MIHCLLCVLDNCAINEPSLIWWYHKSPRQPSTNFHVTTVTMCNATDVEKLPSSGIEPENFCCHGSCSNHNTTEPSPRLHRKQSDHILLGCLLTDTCRPMRALHNKRWPMGIFVTLPFIVIDDVNVCTGRTRPLHTYCLKCVSQYLSFLAVPV